MNQFWVDPEGLERSGSGYEEVQNSLTSFQQDFSNLIGNYSQYFGTRKEDREFLDALGEMHKTFLDGVSSVSNTVGYVDNGLKDSGKGYRDGRDGADQMSNRFLENSGGDQGTPPETGNSFFSVKGEDGKPNKPGTDLPGVPDKPGEHGEHAPGDQSSERVKPAGLPPSEGEVTTPLQNAQIFVKSQQPSELNRLQVGAVKPKDVPVEKPKLTSAMKLRAVANNAVPMVDGRPLEEGQGIITATEVAEGTVRLGVNNYAEIIPLDGHKVTLEDPNDPSKSEKYPTDDGEQHFLYKPKPASEQSNDPDDRVYMEISSGGKPHFFRF